MSKFISDAEMQALEAKAKPGKPTFISDDEMTELENRVKPVDRAPMLAKMAEEDKNATQSLPKEIGRQVAGTAYGLVEGLNPLNIPRGLETLGRAVVTERGGPLERLAAANENAVIPGQEEIGAGMRALIPDSDEKGLSFSERLKREKQYQGEMMPQVLGEEGRLLGNLAPLLAGMGAKVNAGPAMRGLSQKIKGVLPSKRIALPIDEAGNITITKSLPNAKPADASGVIDAAYVDLPKELPPGSAPAQEASQFKISAKNLPDDVLQGKSGNGFKVDEAGNVFIEDPKALQDVLDGTHAKNPKATTQDQIIANLRKDKAPKATADDVAYWKKNGDRIKTAPSLDENAPNPMSEVVLNGIEKFQTHLNQREKAAAELIDKSNFQMTTAELAQAFQSQINDITGSGKRFSKSNQAAVKELQSYIDQLTPTDEQGMQTVQVLSPKEVRQFVQGLWDDNKAAYVPGKDLGPTEKNLTKVIGNVNATLKQKVGPEYGQLMDSYADDMQDYSLIKKEWKLDQDLIPRMKGWFKNRFMYHFQELEAGNRPRSDPLVKALDKMGAINQQDYATMVKDQLVYGRLFPDEAKGMQGGTASSVWTRAAKQWISEPTNIMKPGEMLFDGIKENRATKMMNKGLADKVKDAKKTPPKGEK
jgi:hypothetical protein